MILACYIFRMTPNEFRDLRGDDAIRVVKASKAIVEAKKRK